MRFAQAEQRVSDATIPDRLRYSLLATIGDVATPATPTLSLLERELRGCVTAFTERDAAAERGVNEPLDATDILISELIAREDETTAEHSRAVSAWCKRIAERLDLDAGECTYIGRCGLIHDIGKVETPRDILGLPRSLSRHHCSKRLGASSLLRLAGQFGQKCWPGPSRSRANI